jgi:SAM-dependent methyltransferase
VVHQAGWEPPAGLVDAAVAHARGSGWRVVEVVPEPAAPQRLLDAARRAARPRWAADPLAPALASGAAVVADTDVAERAAVVAGALAPGVLVAAAIRLRQCAEGRYDAVRWRGPSEDLPPRRHRSADEWAVLQGRWAHAAVAVRLAGWSAAWAGVAVAVRQHSRRPVSDSRPVAGTRPAWPAVAAMVAPLVVDGMARLGAPAAAAVAPPAGRAQGGRRGGPALVRRLGTTVVRPAAAPVAAGRALVTLRGALGGADPWASRRPEYRRALAGGVDGLFEAPRTTCPWCGGGPLTPVVTSPDRVQGKPGRFTLVRCGSCRVVCQDPRLSDAGLDLYYRDFYDGIGAEQIGGVFESLGPHYRRRAAMVQGHGVPRRWLDIGTGHGHFCAVARTVWPDTAFDGLDQGAAVEEAAARRWVDHAYRGTLEGWADTLAGGYDVVSMFHYLEHTTDPRRQLELAARLVAPGGLLMVEVPNPECRWGAILGSWWMPWFQPQHLMLLPAATLRRGLEDLGLQVVAEDLVGPHQPAEWLFAAYFLAERLAPDPRLPWHEPPTWPRRLARGAAVTATLPLVAVGAAVDQVATAVLRTPRWSNAYRFLARRPEVPTSAAAPTTGAVRG